MSKRVEKPLVAWHASPYDFEKFGPMHEVSGKGQGAAAYGRGAAYVAESPAVSGPGRSNYMEEFSYHPAIGTENLGGAYLHEYIEGPRAAELLNGFRDDLKPNQLKVLEEKIREYIPQGKQHGGNLDFIEFLEENGANLIARKMKKYYSFGHGKGPFSYEVNVHLQPETMLDWDAPVKDHHPEAVKKIARASLAKALAGGAQLPDAAFDMSKSPATGADVYRNIVHQHNSDFAASEALFNAGIHGIRYEDGQSRGAKPELTFDGVPITQAIEEVEKAGRDEDLALYDHLINVRSDYNHMRHSRPTINLLRSGIGNNETAGWFEDNHHRFDLSSANKTYNYVIFHPDFVEAVAQYNIKGEKVKDLGPGVHLKSVDHDPFKGE